MEVLLLSRDAGVKSPLAALESFAHPVRRAPLDDIGKLGYADVALIDARFDPAAARRTCRRLTASAPALAVVAVVGPADLVEVDVDWHFDDVLLASAGADELQARLRLAIQRRRSVLAGTLEFGELALQPACYTASLGRKDLCLTPTEFKLLNFLVQHAGHVFTRTRLMHEVWGYDCNGRVRTVDVHVRRLRAKLGAEHESIIQTVRGVGYMAVTPPQPRWVVRELALDPARPSSTADPIAQ
ncbi:response regulator transcription factor [Mycobacterium simiae]|uniref:Response regulator transcription factor n=1 Tax=Mycobacterium simiae TaxID=1784 RepID=A0A5B1BSX0_MYCSI|nr:response regulator transcription factor [Mycobacterium simiae]KAA1251777.1 response regulator transcription factor [Mycobacterium simiae]